jgi:starvation-inducible DNA-binding protein
MTTITPALEADARTVVGEVLQDALSGLISLGLLAKQAHWNLTGPGFRNLHLQLDELADLARESSDAVAERAVTVGRPPDGRPATVALDRSLPDLDSGALPDRHVVVAFADILAAIIRRLRGHIAATAEPDPVTQDLLIGITAAMEKQAWMFRATQT